MDNELEIIKRLQEGDRSAFKQIFDNYAKAIYYLAIRWTSSKEDAEDIIQKTYLNAFLGIKKFRGSCKISTWLFQIALNLLKNHKRNIKNRTFLELDPDLSSNELSPLDTSMAKDELDRVNQAMDKLKGKQRAILLFRLYEEMPFKDIAEIVGCTENSAKVNFHFALQNVRVILERGE